MDDILSFPLLYVYGLQIIFKYHDLIKSYGTDGTDGVPLKRIYYQKIYLVQFLCFVTLPSQGAIKACCIPETTKRIEIVKLIAQI